MRLRALTTAIAATQYDWVFLLDSDGQFPVENFERFGAALAKTSSHAMIGVRPIKKNSLFARFGSFVSGWICNVMHGTHYRDFNSALKLIRGPLVRSLYLEAKGIKLLG